MSKLKWLLAVCSLSFVAVAAEKPLYENNFEKAVIGKLPEDLKFATGEFAINAESGNKFLELPGAPLDSYNIQFGPTESAGTAVSARIYGTSKGRRYPTFGVGLNGVGGWRLQISPAKKALELYKDEEVKTSVPHEWKPGGWVRLRLQVRKVRDGEWKIDGKVWPSETAEPAGWMITFDEKEESVSGCASVFGSPFSGTPIWFDDLVVEKVSAK